MTGFLRIYYGLYEKMKSVDLMVFDFDGTLLCSYEWIDTERYSVVSESRFLL
jgi:hypothetical protein